MIFAAGAGNRLVGVTTFCDYPEEAKSIAKIGDTMTPNMETIISLKPDIVFVSTASQLETFIKTFEQNDIAIYVMNPTSLHGVFQTVLRAADVLAEETTGHLFDLNVEEPYHTSVRSVSA